MAIQYWHMLIFSWESRYAYISYAGDWRQIMSWNDDLQFSTIWQTKWATENPVNFNDKLVDAPAIAHVQLQQSMPGIFPKLRGTSLQP